MEQAADDQDLAEITAIRHQVAVIRQTLHSGRDLTARMPLIMSLPGATSDTRLYAQDIHSIADADPPTTCPQCHSPMPAARFQAANRGLIVELPINHIAQPRPSAVFPKLGE